MFTSISSLMSASQVASRWRADPPEPGARRLHIATHFESGAVALREALGESSRVAIWECGELHGSLSGAPDANAPVLLLVARPDAALRALVDGAGSLLEQLHFGDYDRACDYYVSRLHALREVGSALGSSALYVDGHRAAEGGLPRRLAQRLGWRAPAVACATGTGLARAAALREPGWSAPARVVAESNAAYERCRNVLTRECLAIA